MLGGFTISPQRHYPLQQPGVSSVGVLPPVRWDGFRKKSILTPRNSPGVLSPVTVKIARPDHHKSPRSLYLLMSCQIICVETFYFTPLLAFKYSGSLDATFFVLLKCVFAA